MIDRCSPQARSKTMASIRGRGNKTTEVAFVELLRAAAIVGWRRHLEISLKPLQDGHARQARGAHPSKRRAATVRPDFVFRAAKLAVFLDGCFWHKCPIHFKAPVRNEHYWNWKINANVVRDRRIDTALKAAGWRVLHFWEHEMRVPSIVLRKLRRRLACIYVSDESS
ncbi:hypothetical protein [Burkholderia stagnalis]|uniref:hypothetical protein n=1 Tax=Burkholderia stagnalis TaxID=1503054 RepID=UPI0019D18077|nr:hypothetical protein [Burkholderia stagnalis]